MIQKEQADVLRVHAPATHVTVTLGDACLDRPRPPSSRRLLVSLVPVAPGYFMAAKRPATSIQASEASRSSKKSKTGSSESQLRTEPLTALALSTSNPRLEGNVVNDAENSSFPTGELFRRAIVLPGGGIGKISRDEDRGLDTRPASDEEGQGASLLAAKDTPRATPITPPPTKKKTLASRPAPSSVDGSTMSKVDREAKKRAMAVDPHEGRCLLTMEPCGEEEAGELVDAAHVMARSMHRDDVSLHVLMIVSFPEHLYVVAGDPLRRLELEQAG
jgi:hypothetical protein